MIVFTDKGDSYFGPTRLPTIDNKFVSKCDSFLITIVTSMIHKV